MESTTFEENTFFDFPHRGAGRGMTAARRRTSAEKFWKIASDLHAPETPPPIGFELVQVRCRFGPRYVKGR